MIGIQWERRRHVLGGALVEPGVRSRWAAVVKATPAASYSPCSTRRSPPRSTHRAGRPTPAAPGPPRAEEPLQVTTSPPITPVGPCPITRRRTISPMYSLPLSPFPVCSRADTSTRPQNQERPPENLRFIGRARCMPITLGAVGVALGYVVPPGRVRRDRALDRAHPPGSDPGRAAGTTTSNQVPRPTSARRPASPAPEISSRWARIPINRNFRSERGSYKRPSRCRIRPKALPAAPSGTAGRTGRYGPAWCAGPSSFASGAPQAVPGRRRYQRIVARASAP